MRKIPTAEKAFEYFELGNGWYMMHIKRKVDGKLSSVDTYVGTEEDGYSHVGHTEGLDLPGVFGGFREYNRTMQMHAEDLIDMARGNMKFALWNSKHGIYEVVREPMDY